MLLDQHISLSRLLESRIILLDMLLSNKILCATYYYIKILLDTCIIVNYYFRMDIAAVQVQKRTPKVTMKARWPKKMKKIRKLHGFYF